MTTHSKNQPSPFFLWYSVLVGPVVWSVYFILGYLAVELSCRTDFLRFNLFGVSALLVSIVVLTLITFAVTVYSGFLAFISWRKQKNDVLRYGDNRYKREEPGQFMTLAGAILSALFSLTILLSGLPVFFLQPCVL